MDWVVYEENVNGTWVENVNYYESRVWGSSKTNVDVSKWSVTDRNLFLSLTAYMCDKNEGDEEPKVDLMWQNVGVDCVWSTQKWQRKIS